MVVEGIKILLAATSPLQSIIDRPGITHEFCNVQALAILRRDGFSKAAEFIQKFMKQINAGVYWADQGWKNVGHYYEPFTGKGLWRFPTALEEFQRYFRMAFVCLHHGKKGEAAFFLGASAHLVQDLCVPQHARSKLFNGHKQFEAWVQMHFFNYGVESQGIYHEGQPAIVIPSCNATVAADMLAWVDAGETEVSYAKATAILLPLAQRSTAGLFQKFYAIATQQGLEKDLAAIATVA